MCVYNTNILYSQIFCSYHLSSGCDMRFFIFLFFFYYISFLYNGSYSTYFLLSNDDQHSHTARQLCYGLEYLVIQSLQIFLTQQRIFSLSFNMNCDITRSNHFWLSKDMSVANMQSHKALFIEAN